MSNLSTVSIIYRSLDGKRSFRQSLGKFFAEGLPDCAARGLEYGYMLDAAEVRESGLHRGVCRPVPFDAVVLHYRDGIPGVTLADRLARNVHPSLLNQTPEAVSVR